MRRIMLVVAAMLLFAVVPSSAVALPGPDSEFCQNLAVPSNGGTAVASSQYSASYPVAHLNNDSRAGNAWWDATQYAFPDWAGIDWDSPRTIDRIVVRTIITGRTYRRIRIQYWGGGSWVDVVGRAGQDNPVIDWREPTQRSGEEWKAWDFAAPVTTTRIRVVFEDGSADGWSLLEEIAAYYGDGECFKPGPPEPGVMECTDALVDGTASASSTHSSGLYPVSGVNNGARESGTSMGYWNDDTNGTWPDWVQLAFDAPTTIDRIVARIPLARRGFPLGEITLRRTRIQYYDDATSTWVDVVGRSGQDNPIVDWQGPIETYDGSESRSFDIAPVTTTRIRALIEDGSTDGWSWLDELQAFESVDCHPPYPPTVRNVNLALIEFGGRGFSSSDYSWPYDASHLNDDYYHAWWDGTYNVFPDHGGIEWRSPRKINRIVARIPSNLDQTYYRFDVQIQYWDRTTSTWTNVVGAVGQPNPLLNWNGPGSPSGHYRRTWDLATPVFTERIRVQFDSASGPGYSLLEEIQAFWIV